MNNLLTGFLLGLSVNAGCIAVCSPILVPFFLSEKVKPLWPVVKFMTGRLSAYLFFAVASGYLSIYFNGRIKPGIFAFLQIILSLWLILFAIGKTTESWPLCKWIGSIFSGKNFPFLAGIVMGLNICPPFLLGLSQTLEMKSIMQPVVFFTGFYIGSSLWIIVLFFSNILAGKKWVRFLGITASLIAGVYYLLQGIKIILE